MFKIIRRLLIVLIIVAGVFLSFQWKNYQKKLECRNNALLYFQEEDYEKSIVYLEDGLKDISFFGKDLDKDMSCYLAESYYQLGNYDKTVELCDSLLENDPKEKMYYLMKGDAITALGDTEQVVNVYNIAWEKTGDSIFLEKICDTYLRVGDYENALNYADKGQNAQGENAADFLFKKIIIYEKCNDYQSAYAVAEEYVQQYPEDEKGLKEHKFLASRVQ